MRLHSSTCPTWVPIVGCPPSCLGQLGTIERKVALRALWLLRERVGSEWEDFGPPLRAIVDECRKEIAGVPDFDRGISPKSVHRWRIRPIFAWYDLWVGAYIDRAKHKIYLFPLPMLGIVIEWP